MKRFFVIVPIESKVTDTDAIRGLCDTVLSTLNEEESLVGKIKVHPSRVADESALEQNFGDILAASFLAELDAQKKTRH